MKFHHSLLKKLAPGIPDTKRLADELSLRTVEADPDGVDAIEVTFTPNRYDIASHWGIAREAAAIFKKKLAIARPRPKDMKKKAAAVSVRIDDKKACPRYMARAFEIERVGASPAWMQKTLKVCGLRPINAVVDIMNYVMLEVGQPLHAFDLDKLRTDKKGIASIIVRSARKNERMVTLDGAEHVLKESMLLITDPEGPLAIAGIKGGKRAEATQKTRRIVIESASFDFVSIQKTSAALRLATDASVRFAHNLSPVLTEAAMDRAHELLEEIAGARFLDGCDVFPKVPKEKTLTFDLARANALMGVELTKKKVVECLVRLGFTVPSAASSKKVFPVIVPLVRTDIERFEDLVEEVVRIYGYENIPAQAPVGPIVPSGTDEIVEAAFAARDLLALIGFTEVYGYSFSANKEQYDLAANIERTGIELENPIAEDKRYMRVSLAEGLTEVYQRNERNHDRANVFEVGKVFHVDGEETRLGMFVYEKEGEDAFLSLKGAIGELCSSFGIACAFEPVGEGRVRLTGPKGAVLGHMMRVSKAYTLAELSLPVVKRAVSMHKVYTAIPRFPAVVRDISFILDTRTLVRDVFSAIEKAKPEHMENLELVDHYEGEKLGAGRKAMTVRLTFRAKDSTLTADVVEAEMTRVTAALSNALKAEIR